MPGVEFVFMSDLHDDDALFPTVLCEEKKARARKTVSLPLVFYAYEKKTNLVHGAFLVGSCQQPEGSSECAWTVYKLVLFSQPFRVEKAMIRWAQTYVYFKPGCERALKKHEMADGGSLHFRFPECEASVWKAWCVTETHLQLLKITGEGCALQTPVRFADTLRVEPTVTRCQTKHPNIMVYIPRVARARCR